MKQAMKQRFGTKQKLYISAAILLALLIVLLTFLVKLAYLIPWRYDMTEQRLFTLSGQTVEILGELPTAVEILAVYPTGYEEMMVQSLLEEYGKATDLLKVRYIDAERNPGELGKYQLEFASIANGTLIVSSGERVKLIHSAALFEETTEGNVFSGEREITGAIRYVTSDNLPVVYMVEGHQETIPADRMSKAVSALEQEAYRVKSLNLTATDAVPENASILLFASPKEDLTVQELTMVQEFMGRGGHIFLLVDAVTNSNNIQLPNFGVLCREIGIDLQNNFVVEEDPSRHLAASQMYLVPGLAMHTITQSIGEDRKMVVLPVARGLGQLAYDTSTVELSPLLVSSDKSWARVDTTIVDTAFTGADIPGPVPLAYSAVVSNVRWGKPAARVVVIGNSSFAYDGSIEVQANRDLWVNCINWLQGGRDNQVIASKAINANRLVVRGNGFIKLSIICLGVLPIIAFGSALAVWALRRNQ